MSEKTKSRLKTYLTAFCIMSVLSTLMLMVIYFNINGRNSSYYPLSSLILFPYGTVVGGGIMLMALLAPIGIWNVSVKQKWLEQDLLLKADFKSVEYRNEKHRLQTLLAIASTFAGYGIITVMAICHINLTSVGEMLGRIFGSVQGWEIIVVTVGGVWGVMHTRAQLKRLDDKYINKDESASLSEQI